MRPSITGPGTALILSRRSSAFHLGHVAWGYEREDGGRRFITFGSVEDSKGYPFAPPSRMEFWTLTTPVTRLERAVDRLRRLGYDSFKAWSVAEPDPMAADRAAERQATHPYLVVTNNCLDSVHHVLHAYGAREPHVHELSHPLTWIPNLWFDRNPLPARDLVDLSSLREAA